MLSLRNEFSAVRPERRMREIEGEHSKIGGIRYKSMLDDNNPSNHIIDWKRIIINTDTLLTYAKLKPIESRPTELKSDKISNNSLIVNPIRTKKNVSPEKSNPILYIAIGSIILLLIGFLLYKKRTNKI